MNWGRRLLTGLIGALVVGAAWAGPAAATAPDHLTRMEGSDLVPGSFALPPLVLPAGAEPAHWQTVKLPLVDRYDRRLSPKSAVLSLWLRAELKRGVSARPTYLYIPRWDATGKFAVYADRRLVYAPRSGPVWRPFNLPVWVQLAPAGVAAPKEILIHITGVAGHGIAISSLWVGDQQPLGLRNQIRRLLQIGLPKLASQVFMGVGIVTFFVWLRTREQPVYLLVFALALCDYIHSLEYFVGMEPIPIADGWFQWMESNSEVWYIAFAIILITYYIGGNLRWLRRGILIFTIVFTGLSTLIVGDVVSLQNILPQMWSVILLEVFIATVACWAYFIRHPSREGFLYCIFVTVPFPTGVYDILMSRYYTSVEGVFTVPLQVVVQVGLFLYIVTSRHSQALQEVVQSEANLAIRLREREAELEASHQRLRESEHQQTLIKERQRLMQDMHDGVGSALMGALTAVESGGISEADTAQLLRECIDDIKLTIDSLEPVDNDLLLLLATVRYRLEPRFEQAGITLAWGVEDIPALPSLSPERALHIRRMVQEIFTNIIKHAKADRVRVSVAATDAEVVIDIEDNGVGFSPQAILAKPPKGARRRGLANLVTRAAAIGGTIEWVSEPGHTRVELRLPLKTGERD